MRKALLTLQQNRIGFVVASQAPQTNSRIRVPIPCARKAGTIDAPAVGGFGPIAARFSHAGMVHEQYRLVRYLLLAGDEYGVRLIETAQSAQGADGAGIADPVRGETLDHSRPSAPRLIPVALDFGDAGLIHEQ